MDTKQKEYFNKLKEIRKGLIETRELAESYDFKYNDIAENITNVLINIENLMSQSLFTQWTLKEKYVKESQVKVTEQDKAEAAGNAWSAAQREAEKKIKPIGRSKQNAV